jgi:hypothetical protein
MNMPGFTAELALAKTGTARNKIFLDKHIKGVAFILNGAVRVVKSVKVCGYDPYGRHSECWPWWPYNNGCPCVCPDNI